MSLPGFLTINAENQGEINGSCTKKGFEDSIEILTFEHQVDIPKNEKTNLFSGVRSHGPICIYKEIDKSSPKLYQALCMGEKIKEAKFSWYRFINAGKPENFFNIEIEEANIVSIHPVIKDSLDHSKDQMPHMENVAFTYKKIRWIWVPDGIEYEDTWLAPE